MLNSRSVSIYRIIENLFRTSAYTKYLNLADAVTLAGEAISMIGAPTAFVEKITDGDPDFDHPAPIKIKNYKGKLPNDLYQIIQTRDYKTKKYMRYSTDTFHIAYHCPNSPDISGMQTDLSYKVRKGGIIHTSFEEGLVEMAYNAYYVDEHGFPLIPEEERYVKGIENYIKYNLYLPQWELGLIPDKVMAKTEQEYLFYMGSAENQALLVGLDEGISIKNFMVNLIPDINAPENFFKNSGEPKMIYNSNANIRWNR